MEEGAENLMNSINDRIPSYNSGNPNADIIYYRPPRPLQTVIEEPEFEEPVRMKSPTLKVRRKNRRLARKKESTVEIENIEWRNMLRWKHEIKRCWRKKELNQWSLALICMVIVVLELIVILAIL